MITTDAVLGVCVVFLVGAINALLPATLQGQGIVYLGLFVAAFIVLLRRRRRERTRKPGVRD